MNALQTYFTDRGVSSAHATIAANAYQVQRARLGVAEAVKRARLALLTNAPAVWPEERPSIAPASKDGTRWLVQPAALGLRFVGWSDDYSGCDHKGWYTESGDMVASVARGCVYALPARGGRSRLVAAFRVGSDGRNGWQDDSTIGESACVDLSVIFLGEPGEDYTDSDTDATRSVATVGDSLARIYAESEREYQEDYQSGQRAADAIASAKEHRLTARALLASARAADLPPLTRERVRNTAERELHEARQQYATARSLWGQFGDSDAFRDGAGASSYAESLK